MPRMFRPWFREQTATWYARVNGKRVSLGVQGRQNRKAAHEAWVKALKDAPTTDEPKATVTVRELVDAFLADARTRVKPASAYHLAKFLTPFAAKHGAMLAKDLTPTLAEAYSRKPTWSPSTRSTFLTNLMTAVRWAKRARLVAGNPLEGVKKPRKGSRGERALLSAEEHAALLAKASPQFRLFLRVLWACGCRPGEAAAITAENFDPLQGTVRLMSHKTAEKTGRARVIYLPPDVVALLKKQRKQFPSGHLLRTAAGTPWTTGTIGVTMERLRVRAGVPHAIAYGYRHSFATDALANGVPDAHVAELLGHQGTTMLHLHYSHLASKTAALRRSLGAVR